MAERGFGRGGLLERDSHHRRGRVLPGSTTEGDLDRTALVARHARDAPHGDPFACAVLRHRPDRSGIGAAGTGAGPGRIGRPARSARGSRGPDPTIENAGGDQGRNRDEKPWPMDACDGNACSPGQCPAAISPRPTVNTGARGAAPPRPGRPESDQLLVVTFRTVLATDPRHCRARALAAWHAELRQLDADRGPEGPHAMRDRPCSMRLSHRSCHLRRPCRPDHQGVRCGHTTTAASSLWASLAWKSGHAACLQAAHPRKDLSFRAQCLAHVHEGIDIRLVSH